MPPTPVPSRPEPEALDTRLRRARRPGLVTVPEQLRLGRLAVSTSAVVALLALVVAVGCAFALRVLWAERSAVPEPARARSTAASGSGVMVTRAAGPVPGGLATPAGTTPGAATGTGGVGTSVVVHVVGQVREPGLVRLSPGARVADAMAAAGGATRHADLAALNLARPVSDGEQVYVPRPGETPPAHAPAGAGQAPSGGGSAGAGDGNAPAAAGGSTVVNLNTADLEALDSLPGVGPVLAGRILDWRAEHGRFTSVEELGEVSGIGGKLLARLKPKVTL
ncbi:MAG: helix-hairpin-helix domain-containing protein [Intrasporangium sp.]|uniref:ComEA family DNA-binding protein n=1 Tax=Intrasporangium sp. TaxID=1925024 RepID=UPI002649612F|nr:helix-hairpin-helix domain-containing protein [Intrasporangium sp.]MDN5794968.1 helix-hairpin-helix domain-containing protein [Intrasporangium sp.]